MDYISSLLRLENIHPAKIVFIDCVSKLFEDATTQIDEVPQHSSYFVHSLDDLKELSLTVDTLLSNSFHYLIFDAVTTLQVYQDFETTTKFVQELISKVKKTDMKLILYAIQEGNENFMDHLRGLVDDVIE